MRKNMKMQFSFPETYSLLPHRLYLRFCTAFYRHVSTAKLIFTLCPLQSTNRRTVSLPLGLDIFSIRFFLMTNLQGVLRNWQMCQPAKKNLYLLPQRSVGRERNLQRKSPARLGPTSRSKAKARETGCWGFLPLPCCMGSSSLLSIYYLFSVHMFHRCVSTTTQ